MHQAMNGPFADEYWKVAEKEISTLEKMGARDENDYEDHMSIIGNLGLQVQAISQSYSEEGQSPHLWLW